MAIGLILWIKIIFLYFSSNLRVWVGAFLRISTNERMDSRCKPLNVDLKLDDQSQRKEDVFCLSYNYSSTEFHAESCDNKRSFVCNNPKNGNYRLFLSVRKGPATPSCVLTELLRGYKISGIAVKSQGIQKECVQFFSLNVYKEMISRRPYGDRGVSTALRQRVTASYESSTEQLTPNSSSTHAALKVFAELVQKTFLWRSDIWEVFVQVFWIHEIMYNH